MSLGRTTRLQVGSVAWIEEERNAAQQLIEAEVEEFTFSARNELDWLNEHMAEIFDENQLNVAEIFKTPGKLRGKTPRTIKRNPLEMRAPLTDIFTASPRQHGTPLRNSHIDIASPQFKVAEDQAEPVKMEISPKKPMPSRSGPSILQDSGYHSQPSQLASFAQTQEATQPFTQEWSPARTPAKTRTSVLAQSAERSTGPYQSAEGDASQQNSEEAASLRRSLRQQSSQASSPSLRRTPQLPQPHKPSLHDTEEDALDEVPEDDVKADMGPPRAVREEAGTPSDGSSPVRQIIRKSSLSFASLPAREPLTTKKSLGARASRGSVLEPGRSSHFGNISDGKSYANRAHDDDYDDEEDDTASKDALQSKTYTQRLQDRISMLEQTKPTAHRLSKSVSGAAPPMANQPIYPTLPQERAMFSPSPSRAAPGAFPDEDESWIAPTTYITTTAPATLRSPRAPLLKSHTADVMEDIHGKASISINDFRFPARNEQKQPSPVRKPVNSSLQRPAYGHLKSQSTSVLRSPNADMEERGPIQKTKSVSNLNNDLELDSPSKSYHNSPIKAAKDKLSSIIKTSKGLFASSAATSADAMASTLPPAPAPVAYHEKQSFAEAVGGDRPDQGSFLYPSLKGKFSNQSLFQDSPSRQASLREKKEAKEAKVMEQQLGKLDRERAKEAEKARAFSQQERERVAAMERQIATQREEERRVAAEREEQRRAAMEEEQRRQLALQREQERRKAATPTIPRSVRNSPVLRKTKSQLEAEGRAAAARREEEAADDRAESAVMPPPSLSRSQIGRPKDVPVKRPLRPTSKQVAPPARGAPVVIRVNTGSRPFQPSTAALSASLGDSLPPAAPQQPAANTGRAKQPPRPLTAKASSDSLKNGTATTKVRALEAAARKREQDEREAQRKRDAKIEMASQLDAKRNAQRALEKRQELEKAKLNRPPPPPARNNPNAEREKPLPAPPQREKEGGGHKRLGSTLQRPVEDSRPPNIFNTAPPKRPLGYEEAPRPVMQRLGSTYQESHEGKRRKTEEEFDFDPSPPRGVAAPPIRQSIARPKGIFPTSGYAAGPSSQAPYGNAPTAIPPHMQQKPARPLDMTQTAKGPIPFANPAHKTPARAMGGNPHTNRKASARSSPRYVNGELIELPEINTDSEDSDDGADFAVPEWAESPNLVAGIVAQEAVDPATVFGPPAELKMEEVFRNKERWGRFRQRTSSANWSGNDRLTEEEIQKDLKMRERMREQGGWDYGMS